jgi:hypothetical protein
VPTATNRTARARRPGDEFRNALRGADGRPIARNEARGIPCDGAVTRIDLALSAWDQTCSVERVEWETRCTEGSTPEEREQQRRHDRDQEHRGDWDVHPDVLAAEVDVARQSAEPGQCTAPGEQADRDDGSADDDERRTPGRDLVGADQKAAAAAVATATSCTPDPPLTPTAPTTSSPCRNGSPPAKIITRPRLET